MSRPRFGISRCLLGECVRYDGRHKLDPYLRDQLGRLVEWVPVCPEVECGLSVPREPIRLVGEQLETVETRRDLTARMEEFCLRRAEELAELELAGFIFKSKSPSCGLSGVGIFDAAGYRVGEGRGCFAAAWLRRFPGFVVVEAEALREPGARRELERRIEELSK
ncbi:DUF523 domain-containing protein [Victivallis vadensis]|uniref:DUF523 domain-containing protein n=1 Tax=Victivallis vadensis TaxID=172901 RepID=UPI001D5C0405|nr:DUF523 domain-containing protein [Victivallis vadensis]